MHVSTDRKRGNQDHPRERCDSKTAIISGFAADAHGNVFEYGHNDLQAVAQCLCPGVTQALEWLQSQGLRGRMTGSGSAVFAQLLHDIDVTSAPSALQVKLCSNLDVHPLLGWAPSDGE